MEGDNIPTQLLLTPEWPIRISVHTAHDVKP